MPHYSSMANTFDLVVDCRAVQLEMDFFLLSCNQLICLAQYCATFVQNLLSEHFFSMWEWMGRKSSSGAVLKKITNCSVDTCFIDYYCHADALSPVVFDTRSFHNYDEALYESNSSRIWNAATVSWDYVETLQNYMSDINDQKKCKSSILKLFYEQDKTMQGLWRNHDVNVSFSSQKHSVGDDKYCGTFTFKIALGCLNDIDCFTRRLIDFVLGATDISVNINARIALSPIQSPSRCSAHMIYFGGKIQTSHNDVSIGVVEQEWYPYCYLYGAEWFNLLSPMVASRLCNYDDNTRRYDSLTIRDYTNGIVTVQSTKKIDKFDVYDLLAARKFLYPVLYPGRSKILFANLNDPSAFGYLAKPRQQWESIPIFPEEITVDQHAIYFAYCRRGLSPPSNSTLIPFE